MAKYLLNTSTDTIHRSKNDFGCGDVMRHSHGDEWVSLGEQATFTQASRVAGLLIRKDVRVCGNCTNKAMENKAA